MRSLKRLTLPLSLALALTGCVGSTVISAGPSACAELVPAEWEQGVEHAPAPEPAGPAPAASDVPGRLAWTLEELKKWTGFAVSEASRVDQANGRTRDAVGIVRRCEARDRQAVRRARPKILGVL